MQISRTLVRRAIEERIGILAADTMSDDRFKDQGSIIMSGIRSALCVPMVVGDEVLGIIHLDNKSVASQFTQDDLQLLTMMANQAAISLHNSRLRDRVVAEQTQRKTLSRYIPPQLLDRILNEGMQFGAKARKVEVTVLFCDIRGFTPLSERLAPEEVMELLNGYCTRMADTVFRHNGSIDKYIGDAVMAVFGSPEPEPRHALRAIECALEMRGSAAELRVLGRAIRVGIGIHTGFVTQGNIGPDNMLQFTAVGDTVNTASRLCGTAAPHQIIASETALQACGGAFAVEAIGGVGLKGKTEIVNAFRILGRDEEFVPTPDGDRTHEQAAQGEGVPQSTTLPARASPEQRVRDTA